MSIPGLGAKGAKCESLGQRPRPSPLIPWKREIPAGVQKTLSSTRVNAVSLISRLQRKEDS